MPGGIIGPMPGGFKEKGAEAGVNLTLSESLTLNVATDDSNRTSRVTKAILHTHFPLMSS